MASFFQKVRNQLQTRAQVLGGDNPLGFSERLASSLSRHPGLSAQTSLNKYHVTDGTSSHFLIQGKKIYYHPPYPVKDPEYLMRGIRQVISESFVFPVFFQGPVQIEKGDIVFDLGANIGTTALLFSDLVGDSGKVFAFEPVTHELIRQNLRENKVKNVEVIAAAIGDENKQIEIEVSDFCLDSSIAKREYSKDYYHTKITVPLMTLDSFISQNGLKKVHFVKMDIEGAEELALNGFSEGLRKIKPKWSISSYHTDFQNELQHPKLVRLLQGYNYNIIEKRRSHIFAW